MANLPNGWREGHSGDLACPHRDCSVCPECAKRPDVTEVYGQHFWDPTGETRATLRAAEERYTISKRKVTP